MSILVVGSINIDIVNRVIRHPQPGETIKGLGTQYIPGGKGANQAVAASLAGSQVHMLGAVGKDRFGGELIQAFEHANVETSAILNKDSTTGTAFITVDESGENTIILSEGANGMLSIEDVQKRIHLFKEANILLLQNEIPLETTLFALKTARQHQVKTYFNPAPALEIPKDAFAYIDVLILNETEMEVVTRRKVDSDQAIQKGVCDLLTKEIGAVIVTLGDQGSQFFSKSGEVIVTPGFKVQAVDTTAAGDTFIGALAAAESSGLKMKEALLFATAASALAVTKDGAQSSIPSRKEIVEFLG